MAFKIIYCRHFSFQHDRAQCLVIIHYYIIIKGTAPRMRFVSTDQLFFRCSNRRPQNTAIVYNVEWSTFSTSIVGHWPSPVLLGPLRGSAVFSTGVPRHTAGDFYAVKVPRAFKFWNTQVVV